MFFLSGMFLKGLCILARVYYKSCLFWGLLGRRRLPTKRSGLLVLNNRKMNFKLCLRCLNDLFKRVPRGLQWLKLYIALTLKVPPKISRKLCSEGLITTSTAVKKIMRIHCLGKNRNYLLCKWQWSKLLASPLRCGYWAPPWRRHEFLGGKFFVFIYIIYNVLFIFLNI